MADASRLKLDHNERVRKQVLSDLGERKSLNALLSKVNPVEARKIPGVSQLPSEKRKGLTSALVQKVVDGKDLDDNVNFLQNQKADIPVANVRPILQKEKHLSVEINSHVEYDNPTKRVKLQGINSDMHNTTTKGKDKELKVILTGRTILPLNDDASDYNAAGRENTPADSYWASETPVVPPIGAVDSDGQFQLQSTSRPMSSKPAILAAAGTSTKAQLAVRPQPVRNVSSMPTSRSPSAPKSSLSSKKVLVCLPSESATAPSSVAIIDDNEPLIRRNSSPDIDDLQDIQTSEQQTPTYVKSTKDILMEAQRIAKESVPSLKSLQKSDSSESRLMKTASGTRRSSKQSIDTKINTTAKPFILTEPKERTVEEIIASLKNQDKLQSLSEADKRIQEIMDRMALRTKSIMDEKPFSVRPVEEEENIRTRHSSATSASFSREITLPLSLAADTVAAEEDQLVQLGEDTTKFSTLSTSDPGLSHENTTLYGVTAPPMSTDNALPRIITPELKLEGHAETILHTLEKLSQVSSRQSKRESSVYVPTAMQNIGLDQAQRELSLPEEVTYEDVVSIKANPKQIHTRLSQSTEKSPEKAYSHIIAPKDTSSMHHFCVAASEQCLPNPFKGAWNQHHIQQLYGLPNVSASLNGNISHKPDESLARRRSAAALRIINEIGNFSLADTDVKNSIQGWQKLANHVFEPPDLSLDGSKVPLQPNRTYLYWSLAPAKWDIAPARIVEQLCPSYLDRLLPHRQSLHIDGDSDEEDDNDALEAGLHSQEEDSLKQRVASRNYGSADDILSLLKEEAEDDEIRGGLNARSRLSKASASQKVTETVKLPNATIDAVVPSTLKSVSSIKKETNSLRSTQNQKAGLPSSNVNNIDNQTNPSAATGLEHQTDAPSLIGELKRAITSLPLGDYPRPVLVDIFLSLGLSWSDDLASPTSSRSLQLKVALLNQISLKYALFEDLGVTETLIQCSPGSVQTLLRITLSKPILKERYEEIAKCLKDALYAYGGSIFMDGSYIPILQEPIITFTSLEAPLNAAKPDRPVTHKIMDSKRTRSAVIRRSKSAPAAVRRDDDDTPIIMQDYYITMDELTKQKEQLHDLCSSASKVAKPSSIGVSTTKFQMNPSVMNGAPEKRPASAPEEQQVKSKKTFVSRMYKDTGPTPAEIALTAGRNYVILPPARRKKKKTKGTKKKGNKKVKELDDNKIDEIFHSLVTPSKRKLTRTESMQELERPVEEEVTPDRSAFTRKRSIPMLLDFDEYKMKNNYRSGLFENEREWVRNIWNGWFDNIYPPTPHESTDEDEDFGDIESLTVKEERTKTSSEMARLPEIIELPPIIECAEDEEVVKVLHGEIDRITDELHDSSKCRSYHLCRRGALYRKLGLITAALNDLNEAIILEPRLLNAFWHRHLVYLLMNKKRRALEDLSEILKINRFHADALRSMAAIYRDLGELDQSINYYSQVIKLKPGDYESYCRRAEIYEKKGDTLLAMEDYLKATRINPTKTDALFKHGLHYFHTKNWQGAMHDFSELLRQQPSNSNARLYRGQTYLQLKQWDAALRDFSAALHYDPQCAKAFFHRACILRKINPEMALQDFSVSLLIDDSVDNILCYLHRGLLYEEMGRYEDAVPDFEAVLKLDSTVAVAHVNIGLIYLLRLDSPQIAVKRFSMAIQTDPTYLRAYLCRAEAFIKLGQIEKALMDIKKAIHLRPDVTHLVLQRGQLLLKLGRLPLASYCIRQAAEMGEGLGQSATQQAIVQSFLANFDKAIEVLEAAIKSKPIASLYMLLGRIQTKAKLWKNAAENFEKAIEILVTELTRGKRPWEKTVWPQEVIELYYLLGICRAQTKDNIRAFDAFNSAIKMNPKFAEAYYERGIVKIRLQQKGIIDFNRALALNPNLFQAYLSRAAYYGMKGHFCKAILNCNEAIRIQPLSVRAYLYRGSLKYHIHSYPLAIRDLTKAINIDSQCALAYFNRAICYQDSGNVEKALQDYSVVLLLDDLWLIQKVYVNRGLLYFAQKDYENARHDFLMASLQSRDDKKILHALALCDHKLGRLHDSVKCFTLCLQLDSFFIDGLICRGNAFMDFGNELALTMARRDYERAIHLDPQCMKARVNLAYSYQMVGQFQRAWNELTVAIAVNDKYPSAYEGRAVINLQMGNTFGALQDICAALKVKTTAELLTNRGVIQQYMGDLPSAMNDYQKAVKLDPNYSLAYYNAANLYFRNRQYQQALEYYDATLAGDASDECAFINRAITKSALKDTDGALEDFQAAISLSPHSAHIYYNRGNLYSSLNQWQKAFEDFSHALQLKSDDPLVFKRRADVLAKLERQAEALVDYKRAVDLETKRWIYD